MIFMCTFTMGLRPRLYSAAAARLKEAMDNADLTHAIDTQLSHVWMVRAFLKHSEEAAEDEELADVHRELYDFMLALGGPLKEVNSDEYLKLGRKKLGKLKKATEKFAEIQP